MFKQTRKAITFLVLGSFIVSSIQMPAYAQAAGALNLGWQSNEQGILSRPGEMVHLSPEFSPAYLKGIVVHPEDPFKFDFIIYKGDQPLSDAQKREEYTKLTKYFLASLAIPDNDQWVNLSPYEKDRIIKDDFGKTEMGRDLLAQDYMLKQITASLIYPEDNLGKEFWNKVYAQAQRQYGTTNIPVNTFNKVWILPDDALIYEKGNTAYVLKNHLKVMLEEDYLSLQKHSGITSTLPFPKTHTIASQVVRELVLPALEKEVNEGRNFAMLRQVYSGMLLAAWFKRTLRKSLLGQIYEDKSKVKGVDQDPKNNEAIYQQYLRAYKKGVFNYIKEDADKYTHETIPRKYFSGGAVDAFNGIPYLGIRPTLKTEFKASRAQLVAILQDESGIDLAQVSLKAAAQAPNAAMIGSVNRKILSKFKTGLIGALIMALTASNFTINDNLGDQSFFSFNITKDQLTDVPADSVYFGVIRDLTDKIKNGDPDATIKLIELSAKNDNLGRLSSDYIKFLTFKDIARVLVRSFDEDFFDNIYERNPVLFEKLSIEDMQKVFMSLNVPNAESALIETVGYLYARHHYGDSRDKKSINFLLTHAHQGNHTAVKYLLATSRDDVGAMLKSKEPIDMFFKEFDFTSYIKDLDLKKEHYLFRDLVKTGNRSAIDFIVKKAKANDIEAWGILLDNTMTGYYPEKDIKGIVDSFDFNSYEGVELLGKLLEHGNAKGVAKLYDMLEKGDVRALIKLFELSYSNPDVEKKLNDDRSKIYSIFKSRRSLVDLLYVYHTQYMEFYNAPVDENDLDSVLFFLKNTDFESDENVQKKVDVRRKYLLENKVNPFALEEKYRKDEIDSYQFEDIIDSLIRAKNRDAYTVLIRRAKNNDVLTLRPILGLAEDDGFFARDAQAFLRTFHFDPSPDAMKGWEFDELMILASAVEHGNVQARAIFKDRILRQKPSELALIVRSIRDANLLVSIGLMDVLVKNYDPVFMEKFKAKFWGESGIQSFVFKHLMPEGAESAYRGYFEMARKGSDGLDQTLKAFFIDSRTWNKDNLEKVSKIDFRSLLRPSDAKNIYIELLLRRLSELGVTSATEALGAYRFSNDYSPGVVTADNLVSQVRTAQNFLDSLQKGGFKKFIETIGPYDLPTMKRFMTKMYSSILIVENTRAKILDLDKMNHLLSLIPYLVEIETDYDNADNSLNIGFYLIKNMKSYEELLFVLGHEQGHNILELLLGYDILGDNKIDPGLNEAFGDWMGSGFVSTPQELARVLRSIASPLEVKITEKDFNAMEGHDQARSLELVLLDAAGKYGLNGQEIIKQLAPYSKGRLTRSSRVERTFYTSLTRYFSSKYGMRQIPIPVGDDLRSNVDSIFKYYTQKNDKKSPRNKAMIGQYPKETFGWARKEGAVNPSIADPWVLSTQVSVLYGKVYGRLKEVLKFKSQRNVAHDLGVSPDTVLSWSRGTSLSRPDRPILIHYLISQLHLEEKARDWTGIEGAWDKLREDLTIAIGPQNMGDVANNIGIERPELEGFLRGENNLNYDEIKRVEQYVVNYFPVDQDAKHLLSINDLNQELVVLLNRLLDRRSVTIDWLSRQLKVGTRKINAIKNGKILPEARYRKTLINILITHLDLVGEEKDKLDAIEEWYKLFYFYLLKARQRNMLTGIAKKIGVSQSSLSVIFQKVDRGQDFDIKREYLMEYADIFIRSFDLEQESGTLRQVSRWFKQMRDLLEAARQKDKFFAIAAEMDVSEKKLDTWAIGKSQPNQKQQIQLVRVIDSEFRISLAANDLWELESWYKAFNERLEILIYEKGSRARNKLVRITGNGLTKEVVMDWVKKPNVKTLPSEPSVRYRQLVADYLFQDFMADLRMFDREPADWAMLISPQQFLARKKRVLAALAGFAFIGGWVLSAEYYPNFRRVVTEAVQRRVTHVIFQHINPYRPRAQMAPGGIDLNSANLSMLIKRDGKGVVLPLAQQDLAQLSRLVGGGLEPHILSIIPASQSSVFAQLAGHP